MNGEKHNNAGIINYQKRIFNPCASINKTLHSHQHNVNAQNSEKDPASNCSAKWFRAHNVA